MAAVYGTNTPWLVANGVENGAVRDLERLETEVDVVGWFSVGAPSGLNIPGTLMVLNEDAAKALQDLYNAKFQTDENGEVKVGIEVGELEVPLAGTQFLEKAISKTRSRNLSAATAALRYLTAFGESIKSFVELAAQGEGESNKINKFPDFVSQYDRWAAVVAARCGCGPPLATLLGVQWRVRLRSRSLLELLSFAGDYEEGYPELQAQLVARAVRSLRIWSRLRRIVPSLDLQFDFEAAVPADSTEVVKRLPEVWITKFSTSFHVGGAITEDFLEFFMLAAFALRVLKQGGVTLTDAANKQLKNAIEGIAYSKRSKAQQTLEALLKREWAREWSACDAMQKASETIRSDRETPPPPPPPPPPPADATSRETGKITENALRESIAMLKRRADEPRQESQPAAEPEEETEKTEKEQIQEIQEALRKGLFNRRQSVSEYAYFGGAALGVTWDEETERQAEDAGIPPALVKLLTDEVVELAGGDGPARALLVNSATSALQRLLEDALAKL